MLNSEIIIWKAAMGNFLEEYEEKLVFVSLFNAVDNKLVLQKVYFFY